MSIAAKFLILALVALALLGFIVWLFGIGGRKS